MHLLLPLLRHIQVYAALSNKIYSAFSRIYTAIFASLFRLFHILFRFCALISIFTVPSAFLAFYATFRRFYAAFCAFIALSRALFAHHICHLAPVATSVCVCLPDILLSTQIMLR